jgi:hypothetical protein
VIIIIDYNINSPVRKVRNLSKGDNKVFGLGLKDGSLDLLMGT